MTLLNIAGGVALILFGARFLRKGLDRLFGQAMVHWLQRLSEHRLRGFVAGIVAGIGTPSSTAVSLVAVQMLSSGQLCAGRMLAVFLGANVGITAPAQLLTFNTHDLAVVFLCVGVLGFQFLHRTLFRGIGQCLLSLGFLFLGMQLIGSGAASIRSDGELGLLIRLLAGHLWLVVAFSAALTFVLQSSTASIGLCIGLVAGGFLSQHAVFSWVLGANLGIALTTLVAGWASLEGRRLAGANLLVKAIAVLGVMFYLSTHKAATGALPVNLAAQSVHFHTAFNLIVGLLCLPLVTPLTELMRQLIAPTPTTALSTTKAYLDEQALESPALALANSTRELLAMADEVQAMLQSCWRAQIERDRSLASRVHEHDDHIDDTAAELTKYLIRISQEDLREEDSYWQFTLLSCVNELESIGDIIDKNLCDFIRKQAEHAFPMTVDDETALEEIYELVRARCNMILSLLATRDRKMANSVLAGEEALEEWYRQKQHDHYQRLRSGNEKELCSSVYFLDMLGSFRRISSHLSTIAYSFISDIPSSELNPFLTARQPSFPATAAHPPQSRFVS